jgi:hypothetical protein
VEPYPKSFATELHDDAISLERGSGEVQLTPFEGVAPRKYFDLFFAPSGVRKAENGKFKKWEEKHAEPRFVSQGSAYLPNEVNFIISKSNVIIK